MSSTNREMRISSSLLRFVTSEEEGTIILGSGMLNDGR